MADRNSLFRKAHVLLRKEGASKDEATRLIKEQLRQNNGGRRTTRRGSRGGQGGNVNQPVVLIDDLCEGIFAHLRSSKQEER